MGVFWITSLVEGITVSQVFAYLAPYLREIGVPDADRATFVGLFSALIFVVGMPLVPLWGVWADLYSRKAVIARSALVEVVVFACVALSREPWQLALSLLLIGFQLGNTGVMLAAIRDVVPRRQIGTLIALFGVSGPDRICGGSGARSAPRRRPGVEPVFDVLGVGRAVARHGGARLVRGCRGATGGRAPTVGSCPWPTAR